MQRSADLRCIVSNCVVYAKIWDTPLGCPIFFMPVGLEPQVRVWPGRPALPMADAAGRAGCAAVYIFKAVLSAAENIGHRKPDHRHILQSKIKIQQQGTGILLLRRRKDLFPI